MATVEVCSGAEGCGPAAAAVVVSTGDWWRWCGEAAGADTTTTGDGVPHEVQNLRAEGMTTPQVRQGPCAVAPAPPAVALGPPLAVERGETVGATPAGVATATGGVGVAAAAAAAGPPAGPAGPAMVVVVVVTGTGIAAGGRAVRTCGVAGLQPPTPATEHAATRNSCRAPGRRPVTVAEVTAPSGTSTWRLKLDSVATSRYPTR